MKPYCIIDDLVAQKAVNIPIALERIGIGRTQGNNIAVDWLKFQCNVPGLIAREVFNCLNDYHGVCCSQGNKICDIDSKCRRKGA